MNSLDQLFTNKQKNILNVYFTAGFPELNDTVKILQKLDEMEVDIIEIGMPYSDPLADGPTIQESSAQALANGMTLNLLFDQLSQMPSLSHASIILMGYYNQILQYDPVKFFKKAKSVGVSGMIIPDLPLHEYERDYQSLFEEFDLGISFLITPQTDDERIKKIDSLTRGFIYMVSSASITGSNSVIQSSQLDYFKRIEKMSFKHPRLIGFGISDAESFNTACNYSHGAIIGSAFIRALEMGESLEKSIESFITSIKEPKKADLEV